VTFPTCPVCNYPVRKRSRTVHKSCEGAVVEAIALDTPMPSPKQGRECCFCHSTDTTLINGAPFCYDHQPGDVQGKPRSRDVLTLVPDVCVNCGEFLTPGVTKGKIKCKCDEPTPPRPCKPGCSIPHNHLTEAAWRARMASVPQQTRYGN